MSIENKNSVVINGFISTKYGKTFNGVHSANLSLSFDSSKSEEEAKWNYLPITLESKENDMKAFDKKRVSVKGYMKLDYYTPKGSTTEVVKLVLVINDIVEVPKGEKAPKSELLFTSRVSHSAYAIEHNMNPSLSLRGRKTESEEYRYLNFSLGGKRDVINSLVDGDIITVKGFLTGNAWIKEGKEQIDPVIVAMEITEKETGNSSEEAPAPTDEQAPAQTEASPEPEDDDDNIPF